MSKAIKKYFKLIFVPIGLFMVSLFTKRPSDSSSNKEIKKDIKDLSKKVETSTEEIISKEKSLDEKLTTTEERLKELEKRQAERNKVADKYFK